MSIRGVRTGLLGALVNPLNLIECLTLPLLVRCCRLADELAASAMTRGLDAPGRLVPSAGPIGLGGYAWLALAVMAAAAGFMPVNWTAL